jgi:hypothetical protein
VTRVLVLVAVCALSACGGHLGGAAPPLSPLEARYRLALRGAAPPVVATSIYRGLLAQSLFSRCRMIPTDSRFYDLRARRCGSLVTAVTSAARLFLETSASPRYLRATVIEGRVGWVHLPPVSGCGL